MTLAAIGALAVLALPGTRLAAAQPRRAGWRQLIRMPDEPFSGDTPARRSAPRAASARQLRAARGALGRGAARPADAAARHPHRRQRARAAHRAAARGAGGTRSHVSSPLLAVGRVVHARRHSRGGHPVLPGAPAPREARARADARSGRGRSRVVHAHSPARGGPRHRQRVRAPPQEAAARDLWQPEPGVPRVLCTEAVQQELRPAPRCVVRAESPGRGLRGNLRGVAHAELATGRSDITTGRR